jgi:dTDP-4-amino-4,6-dideoxygalactose transaminase
VPGISLVTFDEHEKCNYQYVVLEIDDHAMGITRDQLDDILWAENVLSRRYFYPGCHRMQPYRTSYPQAALLLPETERLTNKVLCLPTGTAVGASEIKGICQLIRLIACESKAVKERMLKQPLRHHSLKSYFE